ncbi:carbon-nitrogen hydrolase family protein [Gulosibacter molinativorax]|uniref:Hydrolase n=1 Tax=Gulosibacter molinativorax TaxID=256821 RepID=A0ABT7C613_9MICO|nr:carbon-nitrogen hydrolase family protein [Gulosibacter molinativorax]MDJ1370624.1 hydrolase [Gulosibacter molinativorax]QUY61962.1 Nitrilase/cyanide hydratase and apolipoprotein N-acyltransferase [Gulosibacter molinativorax]
MSDAFACAIIQFAPSLERAENLATLRGHVATASARGARLAVAPEYAAAFAKDQGEWMHEYAEPLDGPFLQGVKEIAQEFDIAIIASLLERGESGKPYNTVVAVSATGELLGSYRKVHLYDAFGGGESDWLHAGDPSAAPVVVEVEGFRVGLQTCYDLRFPESSRRLVDAGAEILAIPAEWVRGPLKEFHWTTLLQARAIENTAYVIGADQAPPVAVGRSAILDPRGIAVAGLGSEEGVAVAWIERQTLESVRAQNPALKLRRYGDAQVIPRVD